MILIALGANLPGKYGSADKTLPIALSHIASNGIDIVACSRIWRTSPVPVSDQPDYFNAVVRVETALSPYELLGELHRIENIFGRERSVRNAARVLDLDLIAYHQEVLNKPELIVPHPRLHKRGFVLLPLRDIAPEWEHPLLGQSLDDMIRDLPQDQFAQPYSDMNAYV